MWRIRTPAFSSLLLPSSRVPHPSLSIRGPRAARRLWAGIEYSPRRRGRYRCTVTTADSRKSLMQIEAHRFTLFLGQPPNRDAVRRAGTCGRAGALGGPRPANLVGQQGKRLDVESYLIHMIYVKRHHHDDCGAQSGERDFDAIYVGRRLTHRRDRIQRKGRLSKAEGDSLRECNGK